MPPKEHVSKKPNQILFSKNSYSPGVLVDNWTNNYLAEKKDNYVYECKLNNLHSTYNRWGNDQDEFTTVTREMLKQIFTKTDPVFAAKPLVNFTSYPCTDTPLRNKLLKRSKLPELPPDYGVMTYETTMQEDYRNPNPTVTKPLMMASPPWLLNRIVRSELPQPADGGVPPRGEFRFLDSTTPMMHIRRLRLNRYKSFNPATGERDFPALSSNQLREDIDALI